MRVDIYKARRSPEPTVRVYVLIPSGGSADALPQNIKDQTGELQYDRTIEIHPGESRIALDSDEAIRSIESDGYHVQHAEILTSVSAGA